MSSMIERQEPTSGKGADHSHEAVLYLVTGDPNTPCIPIPQVAAHALTYAQAARAHREQDTWTDGYRVQFMARLRELLPPPRGRPPTADSILMAAQGLLDNGVPAPEAVQRLSDAFGVTPHTVRSWHRALGRGEAANAEQDDAPALPRVVDDEQLGEMLVTYDARLARSYGRRPNFTSRTLDEGLRELRASGALQGWIASADE